MTTTFQKAPLVEIIAELRWAGLPQLTPQPQGAIPVPLQIRPFNANKLEEFFMRFGGKIYQQGFDMAERLVPPNFPIVFSQPVYRYRKSAAIDASVLYQTGPGLFSAHAIPPYRSWETFSPIVRAGVEAVLEARESGEKTLPFTSVSLRYIDAFKPELTDGREIGAFIKEILGFTVELPNALSKQIAPGKSVKPALQFALPLSNDMSMNLNVYEGLVNNETTTIMDTTIATTTEVPPDVDKLMDALNAARKVIHDVFFEITQPIQELMEPTAGE